MSRRAFVVVLDACGVGALPDAAEYGDVGADTLAHVAEAVGGLELPAVEGLGLGNITAITGVPPVRDPVLHGRLAAQGAGKDSTAGHRELMGVVSAVAAPSYPDGFGPDALSAIGRPVLCNEASNGLAAIQRFGAEHLRTKAPILYTSQDSVLQLAAHTAVMATDDLYALCEQVRARVDVGRVIARPFDGEPGAFQRTDGRRDFALEPPADSYLDRLTQGGVTVHSVGKVADLFAGRGIGESHAGATNAQALAATTSLMRELDCGLAFVNLIETDQTHGHRKDFEGFAQALTGIDDAVGRWVGMLGADDLLILTADHGCDPAAAHSDHTREYVPLLAVTGVTRTNGRHDGAMADVGATVHHWLTGGAAEGLPGEVFLR